MTMTISRSTADLMEITKDPNADSTTIADVLRELAETGAINPTIGTVILRAWVARALDELVDEYLDLVLINLEGKVEPEGCPDELLMNCIWEWQRGQRFDPPTIRQPEWPWPITNIDRESGRGGTPSHSRYTRDQSALYMCGYRTGCTGGMDTEKRHQFLAHFFRHTLPAQVRRVFGSEYGAVSSEVRLRKMATVIAAVCRDRKRSNPHRYRHAIADWEEDLDFLKRNYYDDTFYFEWPSAG